VGCTCSEVAKIVVEIVCSPAATDFLNQPSADLARLKFLNNQINKFPNTQITTP
jgi:hypothetical protein